MRTAGIIAEYNPFHNGHAHHIKQTRELTRCDQLVVVMSGAFTQRGEPALLDKWTRARMALSAGADLVLELPALFAVRPADRFAQGGVELLHALGQVDVLSFGSEVENLELLRIMADALDREPPDLSRLIQARLQQGKSFPRARGEALSEFLGIPDDQINAPNTVLALEYIKANNHVDRPMELCVVKRTNDYHSKALQAVCSASAIREAVRKGELDEACKSMPDHAAKLLREAVPDRIADMGRLDNVLLYRLRGLEAEQIARLPDVSEGLEMRVKKMAGDAASREQLLSMLKCKRYTMARLSRILTYALLGMDRALTMEHHRPPYARILGFRDSARALMREIAATSEVPLIASPGQLEGDRCFALERRATDLWSLCVDAPELRKAGRDFTEKMLLNYENPLDEQPADEM